MPSCLEGELGDLEESGNCQTDCTIITLHKHLLMLPAVGRKGVTQSSSISLK